MRWVVIALVAAGAAILSLAAPASAGASAQIVIGHADGSYEVETVPAATVDSAIARAEREPDVIYAEREVTLHAVATVTPDDPIYPEQWNAERVRAPEAWARTTGDPSIVIAVVDTGVDDSHPDLAGAVLQGKSFIQGGGPNTDPNGHGTAVAGVAAARGNNGIGIAGFCWQCKILPVRALEADGSGSASDVAAGIEWAADHGADIINLSMAGPGTTTPLDEAIAYAESKGILVVSAAGNQDSDPDTVQDLTAPQYPAAASGVIGVVATNKFDTPYSWTFRGSWADLAAPGCVATTAPGSLYVAECGTSFSAPAVSAILGLAMSAFPSVARQDIVNALYETTSPISSGLAAHGRVDAAALLDALAATNSSSIVPDRIAGADRIATAVELSKRAYPDGAPSVVIARADSYADALAAAPLAARLGAPVLLTAKDTLSPAVEAEVARLGASEAWLAGGTAALSSAVDSGLSGAGVASVNRVAGTSRYDTARQIAGIIGGTSVFVTSATAWPDAVAVSGLAAATETPILLVDRDSVPADTSLALSNLHPTTITVVGGSGVITDGVVNTLQSTGASVVRIAGSNRFETSLGVANAAVSQGFSAAHTWVATGSDWPDALAAGPASAATDAILVLVDGHSGLVPNSLATWLASATDITVVGGEASVTAIAASALASLVG